MDAKFGLRIRGSMPSDTGSRGHSQPMDVDAKSPRDGCFKCGGAHFQRDCNVHGTPRKRNGKQSSGKGKQGKSWLKGAGKGMFNDGKGKTKRRSEQLGTGVVTMSKCWVRRREGDIADPLHFC